MISNGVALGSACIDATAEMELLAPVPLSAVCFRFVPASRALGEPELNELNLKILKRVQRRRPGLHFQRHHS